MKYKSSHQTGFTIVELMVATLVFSVILVIITTGIIQVTKIYYKGITTTNTQNVARTILDSISQSIQFNGGTIAWPAGSPTSGRGCVGNVEYDFQLGYQLIDTSPLKPDQRHNAATLSSGVSNCTSLSGPASFPAGGTELLSPHMRLSKLNISASGGPNSDLYQVSVTVAYGDNDLLCSPTFATSHGGQGGCNRTDPTTTSNAFLTSPDIRCKSGSDSQFCAVSALNTLVQQRLTSTP